jgi:hypothetical protein
MDEKHSEEVFPTSIPSPFLHHRARVYADPVSHTNRNDSCNRERDERYSTGTSLDQLGNCTDNCRAGRFHENSCCPAFEDLQRHGRFLGIFNDSNDTVRLGDEVFERDHRPVGSLDKGESFP